MPCKPDFCASEVVGPLGGKVCVAVKLAKFEIAWAKKSHSLYTIALHVCTISYNIKYNYYCLLLSSPMLAFGAKPL